MQSESLSALPGLTPRPRLLDRQGWSTLLAGALLLLISFTSNYGDENLLRFSRLKTADQIGICLHLAALAALAGDVELATRLRHRARNRALEGKVARKRETAARERETTAREREALEAIAREQRQNRALRAGALFLLEPNTLHRRFLAYIATELAWPPQNGQAS